MDYIREYQLALYKFDSDLEKARYNGIVQEAYKLARNEMILTLEDAEMIHEGISDTVSNGISRLINSIVSIVEKFINEARKLSGANEKWLMNSEVKKCILNEKPLKDYEYTMYKYQDSEQKIMGCKVPNFNFTALEKSLESEDTFVQRYFKGIYQASQNIKKDQNKETKKISYLIPALDYFRGGSQESTVKQSELNMSDMYNYCLDYKNIKSKIQEDVNNVKAAAKEAINKAKEVSKESVTDLYDGTFIYKSLLNEALERVDPEQKTTEKVDDKKDENQQSKPSDNYNNTEKGNSNDINKDKVEKSGGLDEISKKIQIYLRVSCDILSAKLRVHEEMYNKYMAIMRAHVKDHKKGNDNNTDNQNNQENQQKEQDSKKNLDNAAKAIDSI